MKELINQDSINALKKSKIIIILELIISLVVAAGVIVLFLLLTNRQNRFLMALALAVVCALETSFILYTFLISLIPLLNYQKLCKTALDGNKYQTKALITGIEDKVKHVRGIAVKEIRVKDLEEEKEYAFYIEDNNDISLIKVGEKYIFTTYQSIVVKYENL